MNKGELKTLSSLFLADEESLDIPPAVSKLERQLLLARLIQKKDEVKYVPIQPKMGDLAIYLQNNGYEIHINKEKYIIVPNSAILILIRDEGLIE